MTLSRLDKILPCPAVENRSSDEAKSLPSSHNSLIFYAVVFSLRTAECLVTFISEFIETESLKRTMHYSNQKGKRNQILSLFLFQSETGLFCARHQCSQRSFPRYPHASCRGGGPEMFIPALHWRLPWDDGCEFCQLSAQAGWTLLAEMLLPNPGMKLLHFS